VLQNARISARRTRHADCNGWAAMTLSAPAPHPRIQARGTLQAALPREGLPAAWVRAVWEAIVGLWRSPRHALPALLSLGLGLGASTAVFAVFSAMMWRPLPFPEEERLVRVGFPEASPVLPPTDLGLSAPFLRDFQQLTSVFESVATERSWAGWMEVDGNVTRVGEQLVSASFFDTLGIQALQGRLFTARGPAPDGLDVMVLREGYWRERLGGAPLVGQTVQFDGRPVKVLGILRDEQAIPSQMDAWIPENQALQTRRTQFMARGLARLAPGVSLEVAQARLTELSQTAGVRAPSGAPVFARLMPLRDNLVQPQQSWVALMLAAVVAFLLLAAANLAALLATRASARAHEWSVRRALGASYWRLAVSSALEAGLVGLAGAALGLCLANAGVALANEEYAEVLGNTPARLDGRVLVAYGWATLLCAAAGALAPVLSLRRIHPADALRGEGRSTDTRRARRVRDGLLMLQVAVTTVLLLAAGLLVRSVNALLAVDPGFSTRDVVTLGVMLPFEPPPENIDMATRQTLFAARRPLVMSKARAALEHMLRHEGVASATVSIDVPFDWHTWPARLELPPGAPHREAMSTVHYVGPGYFETLGVRVVSGRDLGNALADEAGDEVVVSRSFARALGVSDAVGQRVRWIPPSGHAGPDEPWLEIVGMVEDTLETDLTGPAPNHIYFPFSLGAMSVSGPSASGFTLAVRGQDPDRLLRELPPALATVLPGAPLLPVQLLEDWVSESFWQRTALSRVLSVLALAAVVLSAIGLFGVTSFAVTQRFGELAIRRALGATRGAVIALVLGELALVVSVGVALGALLSWLARQLLAAFLFGIGALDPLTYGGVCLGVALVSTLAALGPALAAARVSPARALA
jgi:putative ABC transport system permease protein